MYTRFAIYVVPDGAWGDFGAAWLGWDNRSAQSVAQMDEFQASITQRPRKYGFHGTIKAPFHLAENKHATALASDLVQLCCDFRPFALDSLKLEQMGAFFALTAPKEHASLQAVADRCVKDLDGYRAPPNQDELTRRRKATLTPRQEALLQKWGYPYVLDQFRFHLTLTGPAQDKETACAKIECAQAPLQNTQLWIDSLCLLGQRQDGTFEVITRAPFGG